MKIVTVLFLLVSSFVFASECLQNEQAVLDLVAERLDHVDSYNATDAAEKGLSCFPDSADIKIALSDLYLHNGLQLQVELDRHLMFNQALDLIKDMPSQTGKIAKLEQAIKDNVGYDARADAYSKKFLAYMAEQNHLTQTAGWTGPQVISNGTDSHGVGHNAWLYTKTYSNGMMLYNFRFADRRYNYTVNTFCPSYAPYWNYYWGWSYNGKYRVKRGPICSSQNPGNVYTWYYYGVYGWPHSYYHHGHHHY